MVNTKLFLILASGQKQGKGFWHIGTSHDEWPLDENKELLDCHRKELIGEKSAEDILYAINLNIQNLEKDLNKDGYFIEKPPKGISFDVPLSTLENIFDFWLDTYKEKASWDTCIGLLNIKKRYSLSSLIMSKGIKGNVKEWAPKIEHLHKYRPNSLNNNNKGAPMWE